MSTIPDICTMFILLTAATTFEIQPAIDFLQKSPFDPGRHEIHWLITGVGSLATSHSLMRQIGRRKPDLILQAGIAGCFVNGHLGEVVAIREDTPGDMGVWEEGAFKSLFELNLAGRNEPPFSNGLLPNPHTTLLTLSKLPQVRGISVNVITTEKSRIQWYQQNIAPFVESMEGASLHYTCLQENISFLQMRSISNDMGVRDKSKWDIKGAIVNLNQHLTRLLQSLALQESLPSATK